VSNLSEDENGEIHDRLQLLEQENSDLQQLVCHLLQKNESLRMQLRVGACQARRDMYSGKAAPLSASRTQPDSAPSQHRSSSSPQHPRWTFDRSLVTG
jgi:hypothetical protein